MFKRLSPRFDSQGEIPLDRNRTGGDGVCMWLVWGTFIISRALLLFAQWFVVPESGGTDVALYARYAKDQQLASRQGQTVFHVRAFEYPPLAIIPMVAPSWFITPDAYEDRVSKEYLQKYRALYRLEMALCEMLCFACLLALTAKGFPEESGREHLERALVFVLSGLLLGSIVHTRLDIMLMLLIILSLWLLLSQRHYFWSFVLLSAAIVFKFVPIILVPIWILSSLPHRVFIGARKKRVVLRLIKLCGLRLLLFIILVIGWILPFYILAGNRVFMFFDFLKTRGIEVSTSYGSIIAWCKQWGLPLEVYSSHSSMDVRNSFSLQLVEAAPWLVGGLWLIAVAVLIVTYMRIDQRNATSHTQKAHPGSRCRPALTAFTLVFFLILIIFNKVLSPQYLLWLGPLVPLMPLKHRRARRVYRFSNLGAKENRP